MKPPQIDNPLSREGDAGPRLVYHYSPRKPIIATAAVLSVLAVLIFLVVPYSHPVAGVLAVIGLGLLLSLRREVSVRIWIHWPFILYEYRSLFRHIQKRVAPWEISGLSPDIVSMWRGSISERLLMETGDDKYVVAPFYSEKDPKVVELRKALYTLPRTREQALYEIDLRLRELHPEQYPEEEPENVEVWGFLEMGIQCPRCDGPVAINGPYTKLVCPGCSEGIDMEPSVWQDLLEDLPQEIAEDYEEGYGGKSTIWGTYNTELFYGRMKPYCPECKRDYDLLNDSREGGRIACPDCGTARSFQDPPAWWRDVFSEAFLIIGAEEPSDESNLEGDPLQGPVVFTCTKCGAAIKLDGSSRELNCEHCDAEVHIPDDLWLRFNPPDRKKRWFTGYRWEMDTYEEE